MFSHDSVCTYLSLVSHVTQFSLALAFIIAVAIAYCFIAFIVF